MPALCLLARWAFYLIMDKVIDLLKESGAVLVRNKNHQVWRLPNGSNFVIAQSTSDRRSEKNNLSDLRKMLGISNGKNGESKPKEYRARHEKQDLPYFGKSVNSLAEKMPTQLVDNSLKAKISDLENQNQTLRELLDEVLEENNLLNISVDYWHKKATQGFWHWVKKLF